MAVVDKNNIEQEACILRFYKIVLSWDYLKLLQQSDKNKKTKKEATELGLKSVKDKYKDVDDYLSTFEPLLFEEVKAQITQRQDEEEEDMEWRTGLVVECNEVDGFHLPVVFGEDMQSISQNDLLLLSEKKFGEGKKLPTNYAFALVEHRQMDKIRLRMHLSGGLKRVTTDEGEPSQRLSNMCSIISNKNRTWSIMKICSLSTIAREYVALRSITYLPYKDLILKATDSNKNSEDRAWKISSALTEFIQSNHNESQQMAINAGLSRKTFVLIQGPPGTGKTQTILGLLSAILHATPARLLSKGKVSEIKRGPELALKDRFNHWEKASPWLTGINPLDANMPENGDDGFYPTSGNDLKPEVVKSSRKYRVRVLVCAPSNSALDEIVLRLMNTGIHDENDRVYHPNIVRIGLKAHHSVEAVAMDKLVEKRLSGMDFQTDKQKQGGAGRDRDTIRASIMDEAAIVFSTLSFSGSNLFSKLNRSFDVVVIDEAAQAVEPATLVPLATGCKQVFLVGDPVQLPATVISPVAEKFGYGMSLFKRFQKAGYPVQMLKTQYRMHPEIRSFPSREFYAEALEDGPDVKKQTQRLWHKFRCFGPFCFFDLHEGKESQASGGSWENVDEVEFVLLIYHHLVTNYPDLKSSSRLAIITPYRSQVKLFCDTFCTKFGVKPKEQKEQVDINTVDGFQGREKDVAIFSCVRSNEKGIGFVADFRRMNVGITRARSSVLVVGNALSLRKNKNWNNLIESAEQRNVLFKVSKPYNKFISDDHLKTMEVEDLVPKGQDEPTDDMDINVPIDVNNTADHAPVDENDYGYGDAEGLDGGFDED